MSQYDFALESSSMIAQRKRDERAMEQRGRLALTAPREAGAPLEGFVLGKNKPNSQRKFFRPPDLPPGFKALHEIKTSRWDVNSKGEKENVSKKQGLGRHDLDARVRYTHLISVLGFMHLCGFAKKLNFHPTFEQRKYIRRAITEASCTCCQ